ncbi:hypothetical protein RCC89_00860 [Cytophagaceae bacterium ABcell3]|nr:hypothetical protein RCC89_00860 [Cytophagaceae bacterium ABcell3]
MFTYKGEKFLRIHEITKGTGYINDDYIFHIDSSCKLIPVDLIKESSVESKHLADSIKIFKGEYREFYDDKITFTYGLWHKDDPNCCPSFGYVSGTYDLIKQDENGKYVIRTKEKKYERDIY